MADSNQDLLKRVNELLRTVADEDDTVDDAMVDKAQKAAKERDMKTLGLVLGSIFAIVASKADGYPLVPYGPDEFGRKVGWLLNHADDEGMIRNFLRRQAQGFARKPLEAYLSYANLDSGLEVVRTVKGTTCQWCLERAGVWDVSDAIRFGVFAKHNGCDCGFEVRKAG